MSDFTAIELQERGGVVVETLSTAIEEVEDHLYTGLVCEVVSAGEWRDKPIRLWFNRRWYEVREIDTPIEPTPANGGTADDQ